MKKHIHNKRFNLKMTVLSPLAINSGEVLSVFSDYIVENQLVHFIDQIKFIKLLEANELFASEYVSEVENNREKSVDLFLNDLFKKHNIPIKSVVNPFALEFNGGNTLPLNSIIKTNGQPYIPGSTIKGAIRNAILYYYLTVEEPQILEIFLKKNQALIKEVIKDKPKVAKLSRQITNNKTPQNEEQNNAKKLKSLTEKRDSLYEDIIRLLKKVESKALGILEKRVSIKEPMSNISVSDTKPIERFSIAVGNVMRKSLTSNTKEWTLHTQEYIKPNSELYTDLKVITTKLDWENFKEDNLITRVFKAKDLSLLFKIFHHFSDSVIDTQQSFNLNKIDVSNFKHTEALLFLGSGKGIYKSTILMAIADFYKKNDLNFKDDFAPLFYTVKSDYQEFPNSMSSLNNQPMGFVKIEDITGFEVKHDLMDYESETLSKGAKIKGVLINKEGHCQVKISINGKILKFRANGESKYEKLNQTKLEINKVYTLEIVAIKDKEIRDLKFVI